MGNIQRWLFPIGISVVYFQREYILPNFAGKTNQAYFENVCFTDKLFFE